VASASQRTYVATFVLASTLFAACAVAALAWEEGAELDVRFVRWVHRNAPAALVDVMRVLTYLGSAEVLGPLTLAAALLLAWRGLTRAAAFVLTAFVASEALDQLLKELFRRARPSLEDPFLRLATYSFPSGHAFASTATYGALTLVVAAAIPRARRALVVAGTAVLVALVAASRVVLGVHYLLDVLAGITAGIALLSALLLAFRGRVVEVAVDARGNEQPERARLDP
jgi:undecaprenyl-diphosphatase